MELKYREHSTFIYVVHTYITQDVTEFGEE